MPNIEWIMTEDNDSPAISDLEDIKLEPEDSLGVVILSQAPGLTLEEKIDIGTNMTICLSELARKKGMDSIPLQFVVQYTIQEKEEIENG